ncbi:hypothetical protein RRG08_054048 [Elysia crispata]|uniref:Integrase zinc-binding domain-containing protein n=1 Tax=Elysia crispata TaxID=231223 RepID=A0AAE1DCD1_9GAST|nr:hypothetical protein RRG08_054048 [Elysia crispata]
MLDGLTKWRKVEGEKPQLVLPTKYIPTVCKALHDDMGHQGYEKTLGLIRSRFFWPGMSKKYSRTPVFGVEPVNGGRKRALQRNLLLPVESVREDRPDVIPDNVATRKALPSAKTNRTPGSISAMPQEVLHEDGVKGTTSELEQEDDGESDLDESEFVQIFSEPEVQKPGSRPRALSRDIAAQSDELDDTVVDLVPLDTLLPVTPRPGSPPPVPVPRSNHESTCARVGAETLGKSPTSKPNESAQLRIRYVNPPEDNSRIGPKSPSFHMSHQ